MLIALGINEIEADRDLDFHCPDTVRAMIQDGCKHLQRVLREQRKKKLEQQQAANGRSKRENNDVMEHLIASQNDTNVNEIDGINDNPSSNFSVQFLEDECKYQFSGDTCSY